MKEIVFKICVLEANWPAGKSVDKYLKSDIKNINKTLLDRPLRSLDGNTPKEAFIKVFDEDIFNKLFWCLSMANDSLVHLDHWQINYKKQLIIQIKFIFICYQLNKKQGNKKLK